MARGQARRAPTSPAGDGDSATTAENRRRTIRAECTEIQTAATLMRERQVRGQYAGRGAWGYNASLFTVAVLEVIAGDTSSDNAAAQRVRHAALQVSRCVLRDPDEEPADEEDPVVPLSRALHPAYGAHLERGRRVRRMPVDGGDPGSPRGDGA